MLDTITRQLTAVKDLLTLTALRPVLNALGDRLSSASLTSAGLVIKAGSSAIVKTGASAWYGLANGKLVTKGAATDMAALVGTVLNTKFNVFCFYCDSAGTLTTAMGTEGASLAAVKFPNQPENKAMIGFVVINPTGTGNFVGGTTALDDATVVPTAAYVNIQGAVDPTVLISQENEMDNATLPGQNMTTTKAGLTAGTTTTYNTANTVQYSVRGKAYSKAAVTNGATPTTDAADGLAFTGITANQGSVFTFGFDSGGNIKVIQGSVEALDVSGNFINAPQFGMCPDTITPFGYLVVKGASNLSGTWTFGSSNLSSVTGMTYTFVDVMVLPDRPQVS